MDPRFGDAPALGTVARAARILSVRSRREAAGLLVGAWRSAFRGGGVEFEESRPYAPGDDVRSIDWNATARTGVPWVKRFREERSCPVLIALDVSASMAFGTSGRSKAATGALATALIAAAAARAGDPVGFVAFADRVCGEVAPGRGDAHTWRVLRAATESAGAARDATDLGVACAWLRAHARRRSLVILLSDFRATRSNARPLAVLGREHDLVAAVLEDPRERELVAAGAVRIGASESAAGVRVLSTRRRARDAYRAAARERRESLARELRADGAEIAWLGTDAEPLHPLVKFFRARGTPRRGVR